MAGGKLPPDEANAKEQADSTRRAALEVWFLKRERLHKALAGKAPSALSDYGSEDAVRVEILAVEAAILYGLARLTDDNRMRDLYTSVATLLDQLRRGPVPRYIKNAPAFVTKRAAAAGLKTKEKSGAPVSVNELQKSPLRVLDAIAVLSHSRFIPINNATKRIEAALALDHGAFRSRRGKIKHDNPQIEQLRREWELLSLKDRAIAADKRIVEEAERFRAVGPSRKKRTQVEK